jgi:hypothetical protein
MVIKKNTLKKKSFNNKSLNKSLKKKNVTKKSTTTVNVAELTKKLKEEKENQDKGPLDEKGNPLPIENPEGGDPICTGGYKIDYQFDPMNDPINPPFRCIPSLKEPTDGLAGKALAMMNNSSSGVENMVMGKIPGLGGRRGRKPPTRRIKRRSSARHTTRRRRRLATN